MQHQTRSANTHCTFKCVRVFVCKEDAKHANGEIPVVHISPVYSLPCARMSAKSFRLVRQLPGDQQEAVREYKHRLCLDPSCRRHDTFENAKTSPPRA